MLYHGRTGEEVVCHAEKVTFYYTFASISETVPVRRVSNGLESLIDRLALAQP